MRTIATTSSSNDTLRQSFAQENPYTSTALFYEDDADLLDTLAESVCTAVTAGNSAIVIATPAHHAGLSAPLKGRCIEAYPAIFEDRFFLLDAEETLARFMVDGQPDPALFAKILGPIIVQLAANARGESPSIFMFGEMGALLWEQGSHDAALQLEKVQNILLASFSANILCAYPAHLLAGGAHLHPAAEICALHSRVIPPQNGSPKEIQPYVSP